MILDIRCLVQNVSELWAGASSCWKMLTELPPGRGKFNLLPCKNIYYILLPTLRK